jgi:soluble lytic murein transglycosylase
MGIRFSIFSLILLGIGCATTATQHLPPNANLLPPHIELENEKDIESVDYFLLKAAETQATKEYQWWITYKRATIWQEQKPSLSCEKFALLAKDPLFPLAQIAYLRAHEVCANESPHLASLGQLDHKQFPAWMQKVALEVALSRATLNGDLKDQMLLSYEKSKESLPPEQKVQLTRNALALAEQLEDKKYSALLQKRLYQLRPSENPEPTRAEWLAVAYDHRRLRQFDQAEIYYRMVVNDKKMAFAQKVEAYHGLRMAVKNARDKKTHLAVTRELSVFVNKAFKKNAKNKYYRKVFHDTHVTLARTEWTQGQLKSARQTLLQIEKSLRGKYSMSEVYWILGRMDEEKGLFKQAHQWFIKALDQPLLEAEFKEKLLWYQAWSERKMDRHEEAIVSFRKLLEVSENEFARSRYQFWLAKTIADAGDETTAQLEYQTLINQDPLGYYGLLAHHKTNQLIPANKQMLERLPAVTESDSSPLEKVIDRQMVEWMISLDEHDLSKRYLDDISVLLRKRDDQTEAAWLQVFNYYARSGDYLSLYEELGKLTAERRKLILDKHPSLIFPRPYEALVKKAALEFGISAELIYSIMRQESAFNPRARSFADAFGLLQMLPEVAQKQAPVANVAYEKPEDLYKPEVNIPVGASFLKKLEKQWNNQFILTVASYNASDRAIHGWLKTRYKGDSLEFIEDIPYEETRGYVRLVMRNLIFYSLLSAEGQKIPFPDWVLKLDPPAQAI